MIQKLIYDKFGIFYSVHYISQMLKNMGLSFQRTKFISDHKNPEKRRNRLIFHSYPGHPHEGEGVFNLLKVPLFKFYRTFAAEYY